MFFCTFFIVWVSSLLPSLLPITCPVQALGVTFEHPALGVRARRFAMIVDNNVVKLMNVEASGEFTVSSAEAVLAAL
jgi:hypothetical protein